MSYILLMNNGYPTDSNPKHSSYIRNIKEALEKAGHTIDLLVLDSNFKNKLSHLYNYGKYYWKIFNYDFSNYNYVFINHYGHFSIPLMRSLNRIKQPVIHWHGEDLFPNKKLFKRLFRKSIQKLPAHTKHIVPSYYFQTQLANTYDISLNNISISPSGGINTELFKPDNELKKERQFLKIGFASGLTKEKGIDILIKLMNEVFLIEKKINKQIQLHYILYGREKEKYASLLNKYTNTVCWDVMPSIKMPFFYNAIDILVFPTLRQQESLGLVALEAMSCGCAVLGTNAFAIKEFVFENITGEVFAIDNFENFKEKLIYMSEHLSAYKTRDIIIKNYSRGSVIEFYKNYFY